MSDMDVAVTGKDQSMPEGDGADGEALPSVVEVVWRDVKRERWNAVASAARLSFYSSWSQIAVWRWRKVLRRKRVRIFQFMVEGTVVGQCAVSIDGENREIRSFLLIPGFERHWGALCKQILALLGDGTYAYGDIWSVETLRRPAIEAIPGVTIVNVKQFVIHGVDFSQYDSWDAYWAGLNKRRRWEVRRAAEIPGLSLVTYLGKKAVPHTIRMAQAVTAVRLRKGAKAHFFQDLNHYVALAIGRREDAKLHDARVNGETKALHLRVDFGPDTYYIAGAALDNPMGVPWWLTMYALESFYKDHPKGRFLLGQYEAAEHEEEVGGGLLRWRSHCRASEYPAETLTFRYRAPSPS